VIQRYSSLLLLLTYDISLNTSTTLSYRVTSSGELLFISLPTTSNTFPFKQQYHIYIAHLTASRVSLTVAIRSSDMTLKFPRRSRGNRHRPRAERREYNAKRTGPKHPDDPSPRHKQQRLDGSGGQVSTNPLPLYNQPALGNLPPIITPATSGQMLLPPPPPPIYGGPYSSFPNLQNPFLIILAVISIHSDNSLVNNHNFTTHNSRLMVLRIMALRLGTLSSIMDNFQTRHLLDHMLI